MKLSTRIMAALVLGVVAGLLLGADGAKFAKTWIAPFGAIFMNMLWACAAWGILKKSAASV